MLYKSSNIFLHSSQYFSFLSFFARKHRRNASVYWIKNDASFETMNSKSRSFCVESSLMITILLILTYFYLGIERVECDCDDVIKVQKAGEIRDITEQGLNATEMENIARFAVKEHIKYVVRTVSRFVRSRLPILIWFWMYAELQNQVS